MINLAAALNGDGRIDDCLAVLEETMKLQKASLGADHPDTLHSMSNVANVYLTLDRPCEALPLFQEALKSSIVKLGPDNADTLRCMYNMARWHMALDQPKEAETLLRESLAVREKLDPRGWMTCLTQSTLGASLLRKSNTPRQRRGC